MMLLPVAQGRTVVAPGQAHLQTGLAALLSLCNLSCFIGLAWDIQWHRDVGRDTVFIPPHLLIYSGVGIAGLLCLSLVLVSTWRYYQRDPAVTAANTTTFARYFHAPLGFILSGFGILTAIIAAPLDDYWHQLYGIDVDVLAPFHIMGIVGVLTLGIGAMYVYAHLINAAPPGRRYGFTAAALGLSVQAGVVLGFLLLVAANAYPLGLYILFVPLFGPALMLATLLTTHQPGSATLVAATFTLLRLLVGAFVPWGTQALVSSQGLSYLEGKTPLVLTDLFLPSWLLGMGLIIDFIYYRAARRASFAWPSLRLASLASAAGCLFTALVEPLTQYQQVVQLAHAAGQSDYQPDPIYLVILFVLPPVLGPLCGLLGARLGRGWGESLRATNQ